ncbi:MAG: hypothetical protein ACRD21_04145 [Vicinamibacteria bacterium]
MSGPFPWIEEIQQGYRKTLTFPEIRKGVVALSRLYVKERGRMARGEVFEGRAKRAAFACFYSPLHFLLVREIVSALLAHLRAPKRILDLGCGLGVAGLAWAGLCDPTPELVGYEKNPWAAEEGRWLLASLVRRSRIHRKPLESAFPARKGDAIVAAFIVNELEEATRGKLLDHLMAAAERGCPILVIEPISRRVAPWWREWSEGFRAMAGRDDDWSFPVSLPDPLAELDRAAGLDHRELKARSLFFAGEKALV